MRVLFIAVTCSIPTSVACTQAVVLFINAHYPVYSGPAGIAGSQGSPGIPGLQGPPGFTGFTGERGPQGMVTFKLMAQELQSCNQTKQFLF